MVENYFSDYNGNGGLTAWQMTRVRQFIERNLAKRILVPELSTQVQRSKSHFARSFSKSFGVAPHQYIIARRLAHAKTLLMAGTTGLCEIAVLCGFADQPHLCRTFRSHIGMAPVAWRRLQIATGWRTQAVHSLIQDHP